jgi:hypothetical protein
MGPAEFRKASKDIFETIQELTPLLKPGKK